MDLRPGDRFDRYTVEAVLGSGGMGHVYRAYDEKLQRRVALKLVRLDPSDAEDSQARRTARLLREARAAAALEHPNAIAIHDVGEVDGVPYIAMELVDGATLRASIGDPGASVEMRVRWLVETGLALAAAHARGLVHRDIKPENVMVRRDGVVKVLDFGIAHRPQAHREPPVARPPTTVATARALAMADTVGQTTGEPWTQDGAIVGTPRYMAPEQLRGEPLDARADQFAWGVVAYELLTGSPPWPGDVVSLTLVSSILGDEPADPEPLERVAPPHVATAILRALAKDREARFASMEECVAALAPPLRPARPSLPAAAARAKASPWGWAVGLAAFATVAGGVVPRAVSALRPATMIAPSASTTAAVAQRVGIKDLPVPASDLPEAKAAYVEGLHALEQASITPALAHFNRAVALDGSMAAAHLRLVTHGRDIAEVNPAKHFARARELLSLLTPRDQALLHALEPHFLATPPDEQEVTRRLRELALAWPEDAEVRYLAASREEEPDKELEGYAEARALDPQLCLPLWRAANLALARADFPAALEQLDRCVAIAPTSTSCLTVRALVYEELGRCADLERDARLLEYVSPSARTHDLVARAILANGAPMEAVREVLERKWAAATGDTRRDYELDDGAHLAILAGDFTEAERIEREAVASVEGSMDEEDHKDTVTPLLWLYTEMGKPADAARLAVKYLSARAAWRSVGAWSPVPELFAAAERGGLRTAAEREAALEGWLRLWEGTDAALRSQSWILGYAYPAVTREDGLAAMRAAPTPLPRAHQNQFHREGVGAVGKVLLLAGRTGEAVTALETAASSCSALPAPLEHTRAHLHLAQALEASGDPKRACSEYAYVLARWGHAKPRSVSADTARARRAALGCAP